MKLLIMYSNAPPSARHLERLAALAPDIALAIADREDSAIDSAGDAEVILGHRYLRQCLPHAKRLKWIQATSAGIDHLYAPDLLHRPITITRCPIFADVVAQHAYTLAWSLLRRIPDAVAAQLRGEWAQPFAMLPMPTTAMILGMGEIGRALAGLLKQNGLRVLGVARQARPEASRLCDELFTGDRWRNALPRVDLCLLALPLTQSTRGLFDEAALRALPKHAVIVNVGRGATLDSGALARILGEGHLGGAALDVLDPMPNSATDPIWSAPRLLITPKLAVYHPQRQEKLERYIEAQVARYVRGEPLLNRITPSQLQDTHFDLKS
ncbi:MAG: hypothetical protein A2150_01970 [Candidatus Muproteobacteria bacterium RBG_16_64_11]|uniref:Uncharacterized protein n=1 Tax=Candidatus Muproteobacteria bacterium RBG_16_64_11 TaxID=1817758 RepID=A0A1F6TDA5_9PROT|nr:MAG: hypothetical protein A2150_01970 [Candidatus Muproteobacteria bacterium RBG_16_64_11]